MNMKRKGMACLIHLHPIFNPLTKQIPQAFTTRFLHHLHHLLHLTVGMSASHQTGWLYPINKIHLLDKTRPIK